MQQRMQYDLICNASILHRYLIPEEDLKQHASVAPVLVVGRQLVQAHLQNSQNLGKNFLRLQLSLVVK